MIDIASVKQWVDNHPLSPYCNLEKGLQDIHYDNPNHNQIVDRILDAYYKTKEDQSGTNPAYLPNKLWEDGITVHRRDILENFKEDIKNFWRTNWIHGLIKHGTFDMLSDAEHQLYFKFALLRDFCLWQEYKLFPNMKDLYIPPIGNPFEIGRASCRERV